jgi:5-methylcytosine-specific restriction endonuclease McrA
MSHTLILNADYTPMAVAPLSTVNWREAVKLVYLDQVDVLEYYADWYVHSPSVTLQVPSVLVSRSYVKTSRSVKFNKTNLCIRDEYTCQYCRKLFDHKQLTMEHVQPRCRGGKTNWQNIVVACVACNTAKGNRTDWKPAKTPEKPTYGEIMVKAKRSPIYIPDAKWAPYLGWPPHLVHVRNPMTNIDNMEDV